MRVWGKKCNWRPFVCPQSSPLPFACI